MTVSCAKEDDIYTDFGQKYVGVHLCLGGITLPGEGKTPCE